MRLSVTGGLTNEEVFAVPAIDKDCAFGYTGESTFPGGLRAHEKHNHF